MALNCSTVSLRQGASGDDVKDLQERLQQLGYYTGKIDSSFGPVTDKALRNFQSRYGLKRDGWFAEITCKKLTSLTTGSGASGSDVFNCEKTSLKKGSKGEQVKTLQKYLKEWGYYERSIDGDFGPYTELAVQEFQREYDLDDDGWFGKKSCAVFVKKVKNELDEETTPPYVLGTKVNSIPLYARFLNGKLTMYPSVVVVETEEVEVENVSADTTSTDTSSTDTSSDEESTDTSETETTSEPTTTTQTITRYRIKEIGYAGSGGGGLDCTNISLNVGSSGDDVTTLQQGLSKMGYYTNTIDGSYGPKTQEAVKKLQRSSGISDDGWFGTQTCPYFNKRLGIDTSKVDKKNNYILTDLINAQPNSDNEGLTHDCTLRTIYTREKLSKIQVMQRCLLELTQDVDVVYTLDGYINDLKIVQENNAFFIELSVTGFSAFLEQDFADYRGTKKQSEHLKDICAEIGLLLSLKLNGLKDEDIEINKVVVNGEGGSSGQTVQMSNQDCDPNNRTESDTWADHRCNPPRCTEKSKVAHGNSSRKYATDTASHNSTSRELVEYVKSRCQYQYINGRAYADNPHGQSHCPDNMWNTTGKVLGNCADFARMLKCICDVNGYKCIICHIPGHFYNAIWENGGWTVCDLCNSNAYGHANHGDVKPTGTWDSPQPRLWY